MAGSSSFGELLRTFRQRARISQSELSRLTGLHASHVSRMERNVRSAPRRKTVEALSHALLLSPDESDELLMGAGYAPPKPRPPSGTFTAPPLVPDDAKKPPRFAKEAARIVCDALSDPELPEHERRALARQIRSFVAWVASESRQKLQVTGDTTANDGEGPDD